MSKYTEFRSAYVQFCQSEALDTCSFEDIVTVTDDIAEQLNQFSIDMLLDEAVNSGFIESVDEVVVTKWERFEEWLETLANKWF